MNDDDFNLAGFTLDPTTVRAIRQPNAKPGPRHINGGGRTDRAAKRPTLLPERWFDVLVEENSAALFKVAWWILIQHYHQTPAAIQLPGAAMKARLGLSRPTGSTALARLAELGLITAQPTPGKPTNYVPIL
jgi:hypothetical protein